MRTFLPWRCPEGVKIEEITRVTTETCSKCAECANTGRTSSHTFHAVVCTQAHATLLMKVLSGCIEIPLFTCTIRLCLCGHNVRVWRLSECSGFSQVLQEVHMVSRVINGLKGQHLAAVCGVTLNHDLYTLLCKSLWLSGCLLIADHAVLWVETHPDHLIIYILHPFFLPPSVLPFGTHRKSDRVEDVLLSV